MQYLIMLRFPEGAGAQEGTPEFDAEMASWGRLNEELNEAGAFVTATGLHLQSETTVRSRDGELTVTDGPYAEAKEILFSFYILDVEDLDAAVAWAAKMPSTAYGSAEIIPLAGPSQT